MSYVVLARKYRPRTFREMVGQEHVVQALSNALQTQRLHHAYLFTGTRGVGKTTVSRILAKSLNCVGPDGQGTITAEPCGVCQACRDIDSGRFVDYTELDAASNRGVEEVQSLLEQAVYKPVQGRFKVFMIDEVHMLTNHAFNAMLKTLEEPPEYLKFVLATTDPQKVPVTVLSRCLQFNLRPMAPETVSAHLQHVLEAESVGFEPTALCLIGRAARGSMRDALSLTDQAIAFGGGQLLDTTVRQMLGAVDRSYVFQLIGALANSDGAGVVTTVDALRTNGLNAGSTLEEMVTVLQRMAVAQAVPAAQRDEAGGDPDQAEIDRLADAMPMDETQLLYSMCLHGRGELGLAPDEYAALTMVLLRLLAFKPQGAQRAQAEKKTLNDAAPVRPTPAPAVAAPTAYPARPIAAPLAAVQSSTGVAAAAAPVSVPAASHVQQAPAPPAGSLSASRTATPSQTPPWEDEVSSEASSTDDGPPDWVDAPPSLDEEFVDDSGGGQDFDSPVSALAAAANAEASRNAAPVVAVPVRQSPPLQRTAPAHDVPERVRAIPVREAPAADRLDSSASGGPGASRSRAARLRPTEEGEYWFGVVQRLLQAEAITALVRELALQSQLIARDDGQWHLRVESESLNMASTRERLSQALIANGHNVKLTVEIGPVHDSVWLRQTAVAERRQLEAEEKIMSDPFVQRMMREFGGKIVPGSLKATDS